VNYRETIQRRAEFDYLHKKQSGGSGARAPHHATPRHATPHHTTPHHATPRQPRLAMPRHTTPHHTTPHWPVLQLKTACVLVLLVIRVDSTYRAVLQWHPEPKSVPRCCSSWRLWGEPVSTHVPLSCQLSQPQVSTARCVASLSHCLRTTPPAMSLPTR
jgi:hypothetical protein